jgi:alkylation response protein AidB-like acyl-CoA dehydrogenase
MNFAVTEEQRQLRESLQRMLAETNDFDSRRKRLRAAAPDRMALWPQLAELGVIAAAFDEAHNGFAGDPRTVAVVLAALGESLSVEPYLANAVIAGRLLQRSSSPLASRLIEESIAGRNCCVLAHDAGTDPFAAPAVTLTPSRAGAVLNGTLRCVRHADVAAGFLVPAADAGGAVSIFHVARDTPGLSVHAFRLIDGAGAGEIDLRSVVLPPDSGLAFDGDAAAVLHDALEWGLLGLAAEAAGIVGALNRATFAYLGNRKQFGVPLATFQALQHRAADMFVAAEEISAAVNYAIEALATPSGAARSAAVCAAKVTADDGGRRVGHEAIQLHGGMGVSDELNVSHYARRLTAIRAELGSADAHRLRFASLQ